MESYACIRSVTKLLKLPQHIPTEIAQVSRIDHDISPLSAVGEVLPGGNFLFAIEKEQTETEKSTIFFRLGGNNS